MLMLQILIVEDDPKLSDLYSIILNKAGYNTLCAANGQEAWGILEQEHIDLIITDIMMPVMDGYTAVKKLRAADIKTPIIMLTALASVEDKVKGLDIGADDYMTKPFSMDELTARLRAITRRRRGDAVGNELKVGNTTLNIKEYKLSCGGKSIALSGKEYELALCFFSNPGAVYTKDELINKAWGFNCDFESNNLEVYMSFLRKKLGFLGSDVVLTSVRGVGYKMSAPQG